EFAKYALLFHLCTLFAVKGETVRDFRKGFVPMMVWIAIVTVLVMAQPNFSMGAMIFVLSLAMLFIGGVKMQHLALTVGSLIPPMIAFLIMAPYRVRRIDEY